MTKYCARCGCELKRTTLDSNWCPNCGKLPENNQEEEVNESSDENAGYIG